MIKAYPNHHQLKFCLGIICLEKVVCRLDFELDATHTNGFFRGELPFMVHGPHWHAWELNRHHVESIKRYDKLPCADSFSAARKFDATLRWYCHQRNIEIGHHGIVFPPRERLL